MSSRPKQTQKRFVQTSARALASSAVQTTSSSSSTSQHGDDAIQNQQQQQQQGKNDELTEIVRQPVPKSQDEFFDTKPEIKLPRRYTAMMPQNGSKAADDGSKGKKKTKVFHPPSFYRFPIHRLLFKLRAAYFQEYPIEKAFTKMWTGMKTFIALSSPQPSSTQHSNNNSNMSLMMEKQYGPIPLARLFIGRISDKVTDNQIRFMFLKCSGVVISCIDRAVGGGAANNNKNVHDDNSSNNSNSTSFSNHHQQQQQQKRHNFEKRNHSVYVFVQHHEVCHCVRMMHRRVLLDQNGIWFARNRHEITQLHNYCDKVSQLKKPFKEQQQGLNLPCPIIRERPQGLVSVTYAPFTRYENYMDSVNPLCDCEICWKFYVEGENCLYSDHGCYTDFSAIATHGDVMTDGGETPSPAAAAAVNNNPQSKCNEPLCFWDSSSDKFGNDALSTLFDEDAKQQYKLNNGERSLPLFLYFALVSFHDLFYQPYVLERAEYRKELNGGSSTITVASALIDGEQVELPLLPSIRNDDDEDDCVFACHSNQSDAILAEVDFNKMEFFYASVLVSHDNNNDDNANNNNNNNNILHMNHDRYCRHMTAKYTRKDRRV